MASEVVLNFAICEKARHCARIFADHFPSSISGATTADNDKLQDQLARFKIWAGNLGVFTGGRSSADYRLRDDQDIKDVIVKLLQRLADNLNLALPQNSSSQGTSEPGEKKDEDDYSSDSSLGLSEDENWQDDEDETSTHALLLPNKHIQVIEETISHLYKITSIVKKPEINSEDRRIDHWLAKEGHRLEHQLEELESYISWSLDRKFPRLQKSPFLKDRLVQTVLCRRRRLLYRENHRFKLENGNHNLFLPKVPELAFKPQRLESKQDEKFDDTIPTRPVLPGKAVTFADTEASVVNRKGFSTYAKSAVLSAISPSYMTKDDWIHHMASQHNKIWACQATGHEEYIFQDPADLRVHLEVEHPDILLDNQISFVVEKSAKSGPDIFAALAAENMLQNDSVLCACPFCDEPETQLDALSNGVMNTFPRESYKKIRDHISGHLESISLESLPPRDDVDDSLSGHRESDANEPLDWVETGTGLQAHRPTSRGNFEIAIICALPIEAAAVHSLFDTHWNKDLLLGVAIDDQNTCSLGAIGRHNVVLVHVSSMEHWAGETLKSCAMSFPGIKLALLVGICGAAPSASDDEIILGDVIVGEKVVQYDFGRHPPGRSLRKDMLSGSNGRLKIEITDLLAKIKERRARETLQHKMTTNLEALQGDSSLAATYPGVEHDNLFEADSFTKEICSQSPCQCKTVPRRRLQTKETPEPRFHFGTIVSSNMLMKSGSTRDSIAASENAIAFDMLSAGMWDAFPYLVIKGASDYADSHKNNGWQYYAAATAAAFSKALLSFWKSSTSTRVLETIYYIPFPENIRFVERKSDMVSLTRLLLEEKKTRVALVGTGGMGKTQLALHLAHWVKENRWDYSVFWASARSHGSFEQACSEIVKSLAIQCADGEDPKMLVRHYLESETPGNWLFILDNADVKSILNGSQEQPFGIDEFLPDSNNGRVLVITRSREVAVTAGNGTVVSLSSMSQQESSNLLWNSLMSEDELQNERLVEEFLETLSYSPLAISQAAAYMNINKLSIQTYLGLFGSIDHHAVDLLSGNFQNSTAYSVSLHTIATTWMISFHQIREIHPLAAKLLSFIAYIEPENIPRSILPDSESGEQMAQAIGILCEYGFLIQQGNNPVFDTTSETRSATLLWLEDEGLAHESCQIVIAHLAQIFPLDDWEDRHMWRQYLPHVMEVLDKTGNFDRDACNLSYRVGRCLHHDGRPREAVKVLEQALALRSDTLPKDDPDHLTLQQELAEVYRSNGQTREAVRLLEHVLAVKQVIFPEERPSRLDSEYTLALAYHSDGQVSKAIDLLEDIVCIREKVLAEDHPDRLVSQHELAMAYQSNGQISEAIYLLEHIVGIREKLLAEGHADRLASQHELAMAYQSNGQISEAIYLLKHIVGIREKLLAEGHADRLASQHDLASAYYSRGQFGEAIKLLEQVTAVKEKVYPENHPERQISQRLLIEVSSHLNG
ncbi:kinesin light chain [Fusarium avenaceum]|nr:kinesin light chain [Fusarium avenaceum]